LIWYLDDPVRSRAERNAIDSLASDSLWLVPNGWRIDATLRLIFDAQIVTPHQTYPISVRYPSHFPYSPPLVLPPDGSPRWSYHQYGSDGELCLEYGPDNWQLHLTGADMISSAYRLLASEGPSNGSTAEVASRHALTLGQIVRGDVWRMLVTEEMRLAAIALPEGAWVAVDFVSLYTKGSLVYVPSSIKVGGSDVEDSLVPQPIRSEGSMRPGVLLRWPQQLRLPATDSAEPLRAVLNAHGADSSSVKAVVLAHGTDFHATYLHDDGTTSSFTLINVRPSRRRVAPEYVALASKAIAVVGCGSMGSKIAVALARAGVGHFLLVDDDILLPENLVRHDLDWREIGTHKAASLARRIKLVNPGASCRTRQYRLGGQESSGNIETLVGSLSECDLIIDATTNAAAFNYLTAAAICGKKPLLWAEIFGGGFGGLIARHRPGLEPDPMAMRSAIENWCAEQDKPYPTAHNYDVTREANPMLASDADVGVIAAHAARLAEDTLLATNPSVFPYSVYLVGLKQAWVFDAPFHTQPIDVGPPAPPPDVVPVDPLLATDEKAHILALFEKFISENPPSPEPAAAS
jgi:sulfur-carrier protein adenylyltransferase/sulfurtransferase